MRRTSFSFVLAALLVSCSTAQKTNLNFANLQSPEGFRITEFAKVDAPRMLVFSPGGTLVVSDAASGEVIALPDPSHNGKAARNVTVLEGLNEPHGLAFHEGKLYVAENDKVRRWDWDDANLKATDPRKLADLPAGGGHSTRSIVIHNGKMYVSAGSTCNVCFEKDPRRAAVTEYNLDGTGQRIFATGLRNAVGVAVNPRTKTVWATVNGRDMLGDDLPPEVIVDLGQNGGDFGWPYCYGNQVPDREFVKPGDDRCKKTVPPKVEMQAHSAPLGLTFYEGKMFPEEYRGNIFVAFHGSWNRSAPTGYKVVRVKLDAQGQPIGGAEDFLTGWLQPAANGHKAKWMGRPAGVAVGPDGSLYVSDDGAGEIYRVTWGK
jgi:glucose/arabinose dehydrogenase